MSTSARPEHNIAVTQPVFDMRLLEQFLRRVEHCRIPVLAGIWPLTSVRNAEFMRNELRVSVPDEILERMAAASASSEHARAEGVHDCARDAAGGSGDGARSSGERTVGKIRRRSRCDRGAGPAHRSHAERGPQHGGLSYVRAQMPAPVGRQRGWHTTAQSASPVENASFSVHVLLSWVTHRGNQLRSEFSVFPFLPPALPLYSLCRSVSCGEQQTS